jgi:hypothetical protein
MGDFESAVRTLELIAAQDPLPLDINESDTRLRLVNRILFEVLMWDPGETATERFVRDGYSDYECGKPPQLLVEAKRLGIAFELPAGWNRPTAPIELLLREDKQIGDAIKQAMNYCHARGIPYGAVSNGTQIICFVANRKDGVPPLDGRALVFSSLADMQSRFREFWNALSPAGISEAHLDRILSADVLPLPPGKLSQRIVGYPGHKNRSPTSVEMQILGGIFLEDLAREPALEEQFLLETYCKSGALSQYALVSKDLLKSRYSQVFEQASGVSAMPAMGKKGLSPEVLAGIGAAAISRRPILLVGDVGVGKSMFIRHLIKVDAKDELSRAMVFYIDFGSKPSLIDELRPFVAGEMERQLRLAAGIDIHEDGFVRGVYNVRIDQFSKGIHGRLQEMDPNAYVKAEIAFLEELTRDREEHLKASLSHFSKGQRRQIVIFMDNVDQRPISFQEQVFLIAQTMASEWPLTAFLALRPETFSESRARGYLAAYQPRVFTIDPPRIDQVLVKRLDFAISSLKAHGLAGMLPFGTDVSSSSLLDYMTMLRDALEHSGPIIEMIDNMCAGNVRAALDFLMSFVGSGHVDAKRILDSLQEKGRYVLQFHDFLRAVLLGDGEYYDPASSPFVDIFDISSFRADEHFLVPVMVSYIERQGQLGGAEGYVERDQLYRAMVEAGFHSNQIRAALDRCLDKGLIASPVRLSGGAANRLRVTTAGAYTVKRLPSMMVYVDAIVVDVPITDVDARTAVRDVRLLDDHLDRAEIFLGYLDKCWAIAAARLGKFYDWPAIAGTCRSDISTIRQKLSTMHG